MTAKAYLLKIRGGVEVDSKGQKAGKGPLIAEEISNTLGTSQDQYLFQPVDKFVLDDQGGSVIHWRWDGKSPCLRAQMDGHTPVVLESHPNDSRVKIDDSGSIQTLTSNMGTGGGNVPMVMMPFSKSRRAKSTTDFETWKASEVSNTINTFDQGDVRATDVVVMDTQRPNAEIMVDKCPTITASAGLGGTWKPVVAYGISSYESNAMKSSNPHAGIYETNTARTIDVNGGNPACNQGGVVIVYSVDEKMGQTYVHEDMANTLAQRDYKQPQTVVCVPKTISMEVFHCDSAEERTAALKARDYKDPLVIAMDRAAFNQGKNALYDFTILEEQSPTIVARGPNAVCVRKKED